MSRSSVPGAGKAPTAFAATAPRPIPAGQSLDDPRLYFNRELSWLDYVWRLLARARDPRIAVVLRLEALAATVDFLDEFFSKRVGGLKRQLLSNVAEAGPDRYSAREQLSLIRKVAVPLYEAMVETWTMDLRGALVGAGIRVLPSYDALTSVQQRQLRRFFVRNLLPALTPLAVDPGHPFPFISNLSLSLAVTLRHPSRGTDHFARVKIPRFRQRWLEVDGCTIALEEVVRHNLNDLFRGMEITGAHVFRVTRNADVRDNEEEAEDLLSMISDRLRRRRFAPVVRLEVESSMPKTVRNLLIHHLTIDKADVFEGAVLLDPGASRLAVSYGNAVDSSVVRLSRRPAKLERVLSCFDAIREADVLVHQPYDCFEDTVLRFVKEAAVDTSVVAIMQTLYRTSEDSAMLAALIRAAKAGKRVAVNVEAKARNDEQLNMAWAERLEDAGVRVTYGVPGLKTHAKMTLVVREEGDGTVRYCHVGTGNYNSESARVTSDVGIFTADPEIGADMCQLFNVLMEYAPKQEYRKLLVSPAGMREAFLRLIDEQAASRRRGRILAAMNELDDVAIIQALYRAAAEGTRIDLIVRGPCRLRPLVAGYSENIRVISIVGRFRENLRIFCFGSGPTASVFIGSADWRRYHLDDRVDIALPVACPAIHCRLREFLKMAIREQCLAWDLQAGGGYIRRQGAPPGLHARLMGAHTQV